MQTEMKVDCRPYLKVDHYQHHLPDDLHLVSSQTPGIGYDLQIITLKCDMLIGNLVALMTGNGYL